MVSHDHRHIREALAETWSVIEAGAAPAVFEAAFEHKGTLVRADVIKRLPGGGWRLVEVKSATGLKGAFELETDCAWSRFLMRIRRIPIT